MKKIILFSAVVALLLQSCSSSREFSKKRYGHLNWIDHDTKVETVGNGLEPEADSKTRTERETNSFKKQEKTNEVVLVEQEKLHGSLPVNSVTTTGEESLTTKNITEPAPADDANEITNYTSQQEQNTITTSPTKNQPNSDIRTKKNQMNSNMTEVLLIALLVLALILIIVLLDDLIMLILGLLILLLIIFILLRILGTI